MNDTDFQILLAGLRPAETDPAGAIAAAYQAGRRDEAAAAGKSVLRWRIAAGVLLAATLGLAAAQAVEEQRKPESAPAVAQSPAEPAQITAGREPGPAALRPLPGSYASMRAAVMTIDDGLDRLPGPPAGGPRGGDDRVMTGRGGL